MAEITKCDVCKQPTQQKCGKCWKVFYCSREHQTFSWKDHQKVCKPFKICRNERLGRYVVATKPIKEGDVVLQEASLLSGPYIKNVCVGCLNSLDNKILKKCEKCGWSLCSKECQNNSDHKPECYYIVKWGLNVSKLPQDLNLVNASLNILRCLYHKKLHSDIWKKLSNLESHPGKCRTGIYSKVTDGFYKVFGFHEEFSMDEVEEINRIIGINSFASCRDPPYMAIYETASLFQHSCKPNCFVVFDSKQMIRIIAGVPIKQGDNLSICYLNSLWPTPKRQDYLQIGKLFRCECDRCNDITEFGTNYSALKCKNIHCDGLTLPENFLIEGLPWKCNKCAFEISAATAATIFESFNKFIKNLQSATDIKQLMENQKEDCPSYVRLKLKRRLISMIGNANVGGIAQVSNEDLCLKIKLCREVIDFFKTIASR